MRTLDELRERLGHYPAAEYIYSPVGYIAWHRTTGENVEVLFLEVTEKRKGHGRELYKLMCRKFMDHRPAPYHSVIGYRLGGPVGNEESGAFHRSLGFREIDLGYSLYKGRPTVLMWIEWDELLNNLFGEGH